MILKKTKKRKIKYVAELLENDNTVELFDSGEDQFSDIRKESLLTDILLSCLNFMCREGLVEWQMKIFLKVYRDLVLESACKGMGYTVKFSKTIFALSHDFLNSDWFPFLQHPISFQDPLVSNKVSHKTNFK